MIEFDNLTYLHGKPQGTGLLKANPEDFVVVEDLGFEPDGEGEHILVRILKNGCNTRFVADALAKFLKIHAREVSFAGQKDKHAVTEQWLCARVPGKEMPDLSAFQLEGCQVLEYARHKRKLRLGALKGNAFTLVLREVSNRDDVEQRLNDICVKGVPNYFGAQRFGIGGSNLQGAQRWAQTNTPVRDRNKRSFWLSAARSALFNQIVAERLKKADVNQVVDGDALQLAGRGSWFVATTEELAELQRRVNDKELMITAPLTGFDVPWGSEVILEGVIESRKREIEGPFGEFTGHYSGGRNMTVVRIDKVSYRTRPIFESLYLGMPWTEIDYLMGPATCVPLYQQLKAEFPEVQAVNAMYTHGLLAIISTKKRYGGFARAVGLRAMTTPHGLGYVKMVIMVDEDVDPFNLPQVMWALSSKVNPAGDLVQLPNMSVLELDPGSSPAGITDKLIIDATTPVAPDNRGHYSQPVVDLPETKAWAEKLTAMLAARK